MKVLVIVHIAMNGSWQVKHLYRQDLFQILHLAPYLLMIHIQLSVHIADFAEKQCLHKHLFVPPVVKGRKQMISAAKLLQELCPSYILQYVLQEQF